MKALDNKIKELTKLLKEKNTLIATAESCTGGLLSSFITGVSGASSVFAGGVVAYQNEVKVALLGVKKETLKGYGAVSKQTSIEMAEGIIKSFKSLEKNKSILGLSITGIAGPGGGTVKKPVGTVYITVVLEDKSTTKKFSFKGGRTSIRNMSALSAAQMSLEALNKI